MDLLYFLREKRPALLLIGGFFILFAWLVMMINYNLFSLLPFGEGLSMGWTLVIFVPSGAILLFIAYWGGSEDSPIDGVIYDIARIVYVSFKNCMVILAVVILTFGFPRMKFYQLRASDSPGIAQLSYYEQRTLFNLFQDGTRIIDATSEYSEDADSIIVPLPSSSGSADTGSSSSRSNKSGDFWEALAQALCGAMFFLAVILSIIFYFSLIILCFFFVDFWLVAIACVAVGMICLGIIDIMDGPRI